MPNIRQIIGGVARTISFAVERANSERAEADLFDDSEAWRTSDMESYRQKAEAQLGTVDSETT